MFALPSAVLVLTALATDPPSGITAADCQWSAAWREIAPPAEKPGTFVPPRLRKGSIERPHPNPGERFHLEGTWVVEAVIDRSGKVVDAAVVRSASDPRWPRYEAQLVKSVRKFKFDAARRDGAPSAYCMAVNVKDKGMFDK